MPSKVRWATPVPGAYTPKTPQASFNVRPSVPLLSGPSIRRSERAPALGAPRRCSSLATGGILPGTPVTCGSA